MNDNIKLDSALATHSDEHGVIFKFLLYCAIASTIFLISFLYPPRFYQKLISKLFNLSFTWKGAVWKFYNIIIVKIIIFSLLLVCIYI